MRTTTGGRAPATSGLDGVVEQQVERYADGTTLASYRHHRVDQHGFLTSEALEPAAE